MYGVGVRIGFYVQAACCILATIILELGVQFGRANSAIICFALLVAFGFGILDPVSQRQLEVQVFLSLVTAVSLPTLTLISFQWRNFHESPKRLGSMLALAIIFLACCVISVWSEAQGPYTGVCELLSGLGRQSIKTKGGWLTWLVLVSLLTIIATVLLVLCAYKMFKLSKEARSQNTRKSAWLVHKGKEGQNWFNCHRKWCVLWTVFAAGVWATCVSSIELTVRRHKIITKTPTDQDFRQWMSLCVAIGTVCSVIWGILFSWSKRKTQNGGNSDPEPRNLNQGLEMQRYPLELIPDGRCMVGPRIAMNNNILFWIQRRNIPS